MKKKTSKKKKINKIKPIIKGTLLGFSITIFTYYIILFINNLLHPHYDGKGSVGKDIGDWEGLWCGEWHGFFDPWYTAGKCNIIEWITNGRNLFGLILYGIPIAILASIILSIYFYKKSKSKIQRSKK